MPILPPDLRLTDDLREVSETTPADYTLLGWWGETTVNVSVKPLIQIVFTTPQN
jgi:hypothetical protein